MNTKQKNREHKQTTIKLSIECLCLPVY